MSDKHKYSGHSKAYIQVWIGLLVLTVTTVVVSYFDFGNWNIFVAMLVATIKAALVCLIFMHLKYDNLTNRVVFVSAFAFLGIFVGLTASDELFRTVEVPVRVAGEAEASPADMKKFEKPSQELIAKGKEVYGVQCAICHGLAGKGDGPAGAALNPKPRDFTSGYWKFGFEPSKVFKTITEGSPGTAMAGFASLSAEERWGLVHFVRSLGPKKEGEIVEEMPDAGSQMPDKKEEAKEEKPAEEKEEPAKPKQQKIPLSYAIKRISEPPPVMKDVALAPKEEAASFGERLYRQNCLNCHGAHGKGGIPLSLISTNPPIYLKATSFASVAAPWTYDRSEFINLVSKGIPGSGMPGQANFSGEEWSALYQYIQFLRANP